MRRWTFGLVLACSLSVPAAATTIRVPADFATIQAAIVSASAGDEVLVEAGTYVESLDFLGKAITVRGVAGASATVLDASGNGSVAVFQNGEGVDSVLEGFTLTGGTGSSLGIPTYGGGIFVVGSSPTIRDTVIEFNTANFGGGIACLDGSRPRISDNVIRGNDGTLDDDDNPFGLGGGIYLSDDSSPEILSNLIEANTSDFRGGGIHVESGSRPFISGNRIEANRTGLEGGAIAIMSQSDVLAVDNEIVANISEVRGGGLHVEQATLTLLESRVHSNTCGLHGAAVSMTTGTDDSRFERNHFERNIAEAGGGALYVTNARPTFAGNVYLGNASLCADGFCGGGAVFAASGGKPTLVNETFFGNTSVLGGGAILSFGLSRPVVINCILWQNPGEDDAEIVTDTASIFVSSSVVRGGWPGVNNIDADPLFVDALAGDIHLRLGSPAVDAGQSGQDDLPQLDIDGDARIINGDAGPVAHVDCGADELRPEVAVLYGTVGDLTGSVESILTVNGESGDGERRVRVAVRAPIVIDVAAPAAGPDPAPFVLYVFEGEPDFVTLTPLPSGVGVLAFAPPFAGGNPRVVWNNIGSEPKLGAPDYPSLPAPTRLVDAPRGVGFSVTVTLQGIVFDDGSMAEVPVSVTNAVVLEVHP